MPNLSTIKEAGLYTQEGSVPLRGVTIAVDVTDVASAVTVTQRFANTETSPIEATYCFPLEDGSAVYRFEVKIGDRLIKGEIEEREKAFERYDKAMREGHGAMLLDQEAANIFVASVGNLMPGEEAIVSISYVAELPMHDNQIRLMIPTTVSPRYFPADSDPLKVDVLSPPVSRYVPYGLRLEVCLNEANKIAEVSSPSHRIVVNTESDRWKVSLPESETKLDRDFILNIALKAPAQPVARIQTHANGDRAVMLRLYPEFEPEIEPVHSEVIFLLDCSGSMQGSSIEQAKRALELCLKTLSKNDRFNIVRFGTSFEELFDQSRQYTEATLAEAVDYCQRIKADLGGTEVHGALLHVLGRSTRNTHRRELIVLTDGEVGNVDEVIELARRHSIDTRIFSFGIGYGASETLVRGLARATRGVAEFISPDERIEDKVLRQFSRIGTPNLADVRIDWNGLEVKQSPVEIPALFSGDSFTVYGLIESGSPSGSITLSAKIGERNVSWSAPVDTPTTGDVISTLWARSYIRELEHDDDLLDGGSRQSQRKQSANAKRILETGLRYNLMSSQTSMVAVYTRPESERATELAEYRRVPIQLTKDWHDTESEFGEPIGYSAATGIATPFVGVQRPGLSLRQRLSPAAARSADARWLGANRKTLNRLMRIAGVQASEPKWKQEWVLELLQTQTAAGDFDALKLVATRLAKSVKELRNLAKGITRVPAKHCLPAMVTTLGLILLQLEGDRFSDFSLNAEMKAAAWLEKNAKNATLNGQPLYDALKTLVGSNAERKAVSHVG